MARLIRRPVRPMWPHRKIDKSPFVEPRVGNPTDGATSIHLPFMRRPLERSASCATKSNSLGKRRRTAPHGLRMPPIPIFVSSSSGCVIRGSVRRTALNLLPAWISISTRWSAVRREFLVIEPNLTRTNSGSVRPCQAQTPEYLSETIDYAASRARSCGCE
jgi:hypothetical protein